MPPLPFKVCAVTDEISQDFAYALGVLADLGIRHVELRTLWDKNVISLNDDEVETVRTTLHKRGMSVVSLNGPIFKCDIDEQNPTDYVDPYFPQRLTYEEHLNMLQRTLRIANRLDAQMVRVFSFWRHQLAWSHMTERFGPPIELAAKAGKLLVLENIGECNVATSDEIVRFFGLVDSPHLRLIWDPGNALWAGETDAYPQGYEAVKSFVAHVHIKDLVLDRDTGEVNLKPIGHGEIDYVGQFRALARDGYSGFVSLEPEYTPDGGTREAGTVEAWYGMQAILKQLADNKT